MQALVVGAAGGIGCAVVQQLDQDQRFDRVWAASRTPASDSVDCITSLQIEHSKEGIRQAVEQVVQESPRLTRVVVAIGALHGPSFQPEKSLDALEAEALAEVYRLNCVLPLLWVASLGRALRRTPDCRIAVLSARVGSIGDNQLGGWYAYRSSKAGLNMGLKSAAIELARRAKGLKLVAYHPGTVDTPLSEPFQKSVPEDRLFTPAYTAACLLRILDASPADGQLSYVDYRGDAIPW